jgi:hypothetical protein
MRGAATGKIDLVRAVFSGRVARGSFHLQFSALLDNAFNRPQFFAPHGSGFVDLTSYLIDGDPANGTTGVLGADAISNVEGFSPGRVTRLGIRVTY